MNSSKLINLKKSLQITKLGKTEKKVLVALLEQREHDYPDSYYYPEGNDYIGIAELVYGITERVYSWGKKLTESTYSTLSSVLHRLYKKGLVKMCTPDHRFGHYGYGWESQLLGLHVDEWSGGEGNYIHLQRFLQPGGWSKLPRLPYRTHKWWMLTDNGKKIADLLKEDV